MSTKRTGLGRGIGALIPTSDGAERPVDVFFPNGSAEAPAELMSVPGARLAQLNALELPENRFGAPEATPAENQFQFLMSVFAHLFLFPI